MIRRRSVIHERCVRGSRCADRKAMQTALAADQSIKWEE